MKADEARQIAKQALAGPAIEMYLSVIYAQVSERAERGETTLFLNLPAVVTSCVGAREKTAFDDARPNQQEAILQRLRDGGYEVKRLGPQDEKKPNGPGYWVISWAEEESQEASDPESGGDSE